MKSVNERYLTLKCSNTAAGCIAKIGTFSKWCLQSSALSQSESEFIVSFWKLHLVAAPLKRDEVIVLDEDHFHKRNNKKYMIKPDVPEAGFQISVLAIWLAGQDKRSWLVKRVRR